ncbi:hypothetical protein F9C07_10835 [Aspergillus flavus]|uniref:Uncharacterized protein n=1 Tax=Aspergillus flavus (strain ATCC 200026 / FGSC A1120 / IAM 13836 / NRRL 3357 / JCM 12722 / SRRC 167) TaxID=332952 RepID=A0A7U2MRT2_ASPFN|nr:hypothetical protein F9C07_10835 [Aspergillus flavus]
MCTIGEACERRKPEYYFNLDLPPAGSCILTRDSRWSILFSWNTAFLSRSYLSCPNWNFQAT